MQEYLMTGINDNAGGFADCEFCRHGPKLCRRIELTDDCECRNFDANGTFLINKEEIAL